MSKVIPFPMPHHRGINGDTGETHPENHSRPHMAFQNSNEIPSSTENCLRRCVDQKRGSATIRPDQLTHLDVGRSALAVAALLVESGKAVIVGKTPANVFLTRRC
jgi:hypothetical protein